MRTVSMLNSSKFLIKKTVIISAAGTLENAVIFLAAISRGVPTIGVC